MIPERHTGSWVERLVADLILGFPSELERTEAFEECGVLEKGRTVLLCSSLQASLFGESADCGKRRAFGLNVGSKIAPELDWK
jgi:hypothetical protein